MNVSLLLCSTARGLGQICLPLQGVLWALSLFFLSHYLSSRLRVPVCLSASWRALVEMARSQSSHWTRGQEDERGARGGAGAHSRATHYAGPATTCLRIALFCTCRSGASKLFRGGRRRASVEPTPRRRVEEKRVLSNRRVCHPVDADRPLIRPWVTAAR